MMAKQAQTVRDLWDNTKNQNAGEHLQMFTSYLEFREPLDGFKRPQNSQNSEGLYCLDVSAFVVSVDVEIRYLGTELYTQTDACKDTWRRHI